MNFPEMVLENFSNNLFGWLDLFGQFVATVDQPGVAGSVKMKDWNVWLLVEQKQQSKAWVIFFEMYQEALETLEHNFARPQLVVKAYMRKVRAHLLIEPHDREKLSSGVRLFESAPPLWL